MMRRRRRRDPNIPIRLPRVLLTPAEPDDAGEYVLQVDDGDPTIVQAAALGQSLAHIADQVGGPIRVEVHDSDGGVHADILHPKPSPPQTQPPPRSVFAVTYTGFTPGEAVLIARVDRHVQADRDGTVSLETTTEDTAGHDIVLHGTASGVTITGGRE